MQGDDLARRIFLKDDRLRPSLRAVVYVIASLIATGVLSSLILPLVGADPTRRPAPDRIPIGYQMAFESAMAIAVVGTAILLRRVLDRRSIASLGLAFRSGWGVSLATGVLIGAGMQALIFAMDSMLGYSHVTGLQSVGGDALEFARFIPFFIAVAIAEETPMRGYLFQNLWEEWGRIPAIAITAALFAAIHLGNPNSHANIWYTLAGLASFGVWACLSVIWTRSLWLAIGVHFAWNVFEGPVLGFPVSGLSFGTTAIAQNIAGPVWFTGGPFGPESGASSLIALGAGLAVVYWLFKRGAFRSAYDSREFYAIDRTKNGEAAIASPPLSTPSAPSSGD